MRRTLLVGALVLATPVLARAIDCDDAGRQRTRLVCDPARSEYDSRRCEERVADHQRGCAGRLEDYQRKLADAERSGNREEINKNRKRIEDVRALQDQLPKFREIARANPTRPRNEPGGSERPSGAGAGLPGLGAGQDPQGGSAGGELRRSEEAMRAGDFAAAERAATRAIEADPRDPEAYGARMKARAALGDSRGAKSDARRVLDLEPKPELGQTAMSLIGQQAELAQAAARIKGQKLDFQNRAPEGGFGPSRDAGRAGRPNPDARQAAGGSAAAGAGAALAAISSAGRAPALDPKQVAAAAAALPAAAGGPKNEAADRAYHKLRVRDFSGAYDEATKAIAERDDARSRTLRAAAANRLGRHEQALEDADAALAHKPKDVTALLERGYAKYKLGRYGEALVDVDEALVIDPLNAIGYLYRGMILEKLSRVSDSLTAYFKAAELDPGLKPVADEAQTRLEGKPKTTPSPRQALAARAASRWKLWAALLALAAALVGLGLRRAGRPDWATPATPLR